MSQPITPADDVSEIEPTQPPQAPYNASIGALSLAFNRVHLAWWGGGRNERCDCPDLPSEECAPRNPRVAWTA